MCGVMSGFLAAIKLPLSTTQVCNHDSLQLQLAIHAHQQSTDWGAGREGVSQDVERSPLFAILLPSSKVACATNSRLLFQQSSPVLACKNRTVMERILIVEDDQAVQKALKRLFEAEGYNVEISGDGKSAIDTFRSSAPTAVILDLRLPV